MAKTNRASRVRAAAAELASLHGSKFDVTFDGGARWDLQWADGPSRATVAEELSKMDLAGADIQTHRNYSSRTIAIAVIRAASAGENVRSMKADSWSSAGLEWKLEDVDHPERAEDSREEQMVERLLAAATPPGWSWPEHGRILELVVSRGLAWLREADPASEMHHAVPALSTSLAPLEVLTARYAQGEARWRWERQLKVMETQALVDAALADPDIDTPTSLALVSVLAQLRIERAKAETSAISTAIRTGATRQQIAAALGGISEGLGGRPSSRSSADSGSSAIRAWPGIRSEADRGRQRYAVPSPSGFATTPDDGDYDGRDNAPLCLVSST